MAEEKYVTHVLGEHLEVGDEISTDDMRVWHEIVDICNEDGLPEEMERELEEETGDPQYLRLTFSDQSGMVVRKDQEQRVRRHRR